LALYISKTDEIRTALFSIQNRVKLTSISTTTNTDYQLSYSL